MELKATASGGSETLDQAISRVWQHEWMHKRSGSTLKSQAEHAATGVAYWVIQRHPEREAPSAASGRRSVAVSEVTQADIQQATKAWYIAGLSPATITKRLNCLSKLGVSVEGCRVKVPNQLKWHLKESDKPKVLAWLNEKPSTDGIYKIAADFIEWTTLTGLRIEESLRLTRGAFGTDGAVLSDYWVYSSVSVPGLKTAASQAVLPLGRSASEIIKRRFSSSFLLHAAGEHYTAFPITYDELNEVWQAVRKHFGWQDDPTATLKALRRSAARYLHVDCGMPLHMVQQYLRHGSLETTLGYLKLTGGYGTEEMRRFLE